MKYKIGEIIPKEGTIIINEGRRTVEVTVVNMGDRSVQVGSHFHFFEANKALKFEREKAFGMHLDIPSSTAVRFEPGAEKKVSLTEYAGEKTVRGFNGLVNGDTRDENVKAKAMQNAKDKGFL